ncbi:PEP-CTERM sorting domain-containing protein [Verrucomicrobia bacterium S94]|nr:PEP-CTERM sorting domain-containing protein [Verrucomicrobia bacterium S94]
MKKTATAVAVISMMAGISQATPISFGDNFDDGNLDGWIQKWTATQNSLFNNGGTTANLSGLAEANYHAYMDTGFSLTGSETGTISSDIRLEHTGIAPTAVNENFFGLYITDNTDWWAGSSQSHAIANRGGAIGNRVNADPWIEGWVTWNNVGIDTSVGGVGSWFSIDWNLSVSNGTYWGEATLNHDTGSYTMTAMDLGIAEGTTIYAGYSTAWNPSGTNIMTSASMKSIEVDNFSVEVIPEPATLGLVAMFGGAVLFIRRRFMI